MATMRTCESCGDDFPAVARQKHCTVLCRFLSKIEYPKDTSCWSWVSTLDTYGYGQLNIEGTMRLAHAGARRRYAEVQS